MAMQMDNLRGIFGVRNIERMKNKRFLLWV